MTDQAVALEYGKAPARRWRRWVRPVAVWMGFAAISIGAWQILSSPRVLLLRWQRQCLRYAAPPTTVAYDETPTAKGMLAQPDVQPGRDPRIGGVIFAYREPPSFTAYRMHPATTTGLSWLAPGPVMLHARDAGGGERLVAVSIQRVARINLLLKVPGQWDTLFFAAVARPAGWTNNVTAKQGEWACPEFAAPAEVGALRLYAGQADPGDASHFTIDCDTAAGRRVIDGWLQPDDTLKFALRPLPSSAPATAPAPPAR
jgi:hypothetical protein